jgi:ADP-heptose:LPS heptosyltransferase
LIFFLGTILIIILRPASILLGKILRRNHDLVIRNHLVITKLKGGGSLLVALPALLSLRKKYPTKKFTLVTTNEVKPFAELMGVFDEILLVDTTSLVLFFVSSLKAIGASWRADGLINFEIHSKLATVFSCLTCARNRFGFYNQMNSWQRDVITHLLFYNITSPVYVNYNQVAIALEAEIIPYGEVVDYFAKVNNLPSQLSSPTGLTKIVIAPFCSELGKEREFSPVHWAVILKSKIKNIASEIIVLGGKSDILRSPILIELLRKQFSTCTISDLVGKTSLVEAAMLINSANEFLTIDSGLNHIARLIGGGVKITSYWGPSDPKTRLAPFPSLLENVIYKKLFCSPCIHIVDSPPCKGSNICMKQYVEQDLNQYSTGGWIMISDSAIPKII